MKPYWKNSSGKLYHGNCINILPSLEGQVDLVVTSPPYDDLRVYEKKSIWDWEVFTSIANLLFKAVKPGGVVVWIVNDKTDINNGGESGSSFKQALYFKEIGFILNDTMIWEKKQIKFPEFYRYYQCTEYMFILSKGIPKTFNPIKDRVNLGYNGKIKTATNKFWKADKETGIEKPTLLNVRKVNLKRHGTRINVWKYKTETTIAKKYGFPAAFPEKLARDHIVSWSNEGDIVLDPMSGSGTTVCVAQQLNRKWIAIEAVENYCKTIVKRITDNKGKKIKQRDANEKYLTNRRNSIKKLLSNL
ncbi:MAG TPA: site-specific DNA-methyltransferase [Candidatus Glassbacteria bacterium]|nr:site-specific DNA-methyltransferase [Candidatus Glassbacteria bacterium]